jgi:dihydrofolate reductase
MRKVILSMFMSLDGFIEAPNHELVPPDWTDDLIPYWIDANLATTGTILYGRVAYLMNAAFWEPAATDPGSPAAKIDHAPTMNRLQKIVFSKSLAEPVWDNSRIVRGDMVAEVSRLKAEPGGDIVMFGGADIASHGIRERLFDEYRFMITPLVLGAGNPLFRGSHHRFKLELLSSRQLDTGAMILHYRDPH